MATSISVFFPAFNDATSLPTLVATAFQVLTLRVIDYEVIVVNDGSTDSTAIVLQDLQRIYPEHFRVVTHPRNRGYGAALRSGFQAATKDWVFYTDGDGQYDVAELHSLLDALNERTGLVNGYKVQRRDPWHRVAIGFLYNRFARALFGIGIRDIDCDFRLVRRDLLQADDLQSTSGTVCIELVKKLELTGAEITEVPVSHYPRLHGRSQFFRVRSLISTFLELCVFFFRSASRPTLATVVAMAALLGCLGLVTYARSLGLPFIADDYVQIELGREYGPMEKWGALAQDALYRCRATSLVMTHWTERWFGLGSPWFNASSLLVHVINSLLVFLLGVWRPVGWKVSAVAAAFFAVSSHHQEAVIWYAALPELLVFTFAVSSLICWIVWVQSRSWVALAASFALFATALISKESAVAVLPLMAAALLYQDGRSWKRLAAIAPFAVLGIGYFYLAYQSRNTHLHFNDGTFALTSPFWRVLANSMGRLLWIWGGIAIGALGYWKAWRWNTVVGAAVLWMAITLLPYSFLTYMTRVPSRHSYLASAGLAMIIAAGLLELWSRTHVRHRSLTVGALAAVIGIHHITYIWTAKHAQFVLRAAPTEQLLSIVNRTSGPVYLKCFPYDKSVAIYAVNQLGGPGNLWRPLVIGSAAQDQPEAFDLCNTTTGRGSF